MHGYAADPREGSNKTVATVLSFPSSTACEGNFQRPYVQVSALEVGMKRWREPLGTVLGEASPGHGSPLGPAQAG